MFKIIVFSLIFIKYEKSVFVSVGSYPSMRDTDINLPECGYNRIPETISISFNSKCYSNEYENRSFLREPLIPPLGITPSSRILNGESVEDGEAPWAVYLELKSYVLVNYKFTVFRFDTLYRKCSGVLITFEWVLTSAHCLDKWPGNTITIHAGSSARVGYETKVSHRDKWFIHPKYINASLLYPKEPKKASISRVLSDIALVKTESKFTKHLKEDNVYRINAICLPDIKGNTLPINDDRENATFYGFGIINEKLQYNHRIEKIRLVLEPADDCRWNLLPGMYCANHSESNPRSCKGDSGGPLVKFITNNYQAVLLGILRGLRTNTTCSSYNETIKSHYNMVYRFIPWIFETIRNN